MARIAWLIAWLLASCLTCAQAALPETPRFRHFGVADGLPSSVVNWIDQDRHGYLWVATGDGLARYDGVDWHIYRHDPEDPGSLPGNYVQALLVDAEDRIWVGVEGRGLSVMDARREGFVHIARDGEQGIGTNDVWAIAQAADRAIWLGSFQQGLIRLDPEGGVDRLMDGETVISLAVAGEVLWVGTADGLAAWDGSRLERVAAAQLSGPLVLSLTPDSRGGLWVGTNRGLDYRDPGGMLRPVPWSGQLSDPAVQAVVEAEDGALWLATHRGLDQQREGRVVARGGSDAGGMGGASLMHGFRDREGSLWFGGRGGRGGLWQLPDGWRTFASLGHREDDPRTPSSLLVRGVAEAGPEHVWLAGSGGLDRLDLGSGVVERVLSPDRLPDRRLWSVRQRSDHSVWIGHHAGLLRYQPLTGALQSWAATAPGAEPGIDEVPPGPLDLMHETPDGSLWLATHGGGLQRRDGEGRVLTTVLPNDGRGLTAASAEQLGTGPDGALWVAGPQGLLRWDEAGERFEPVPGAPGERVFAFDIGAGDRVWLHRLGALEHYRFSGGRLELVQSVGAPEGLPPVESGGLTLDPAGGVWLTTPRGLVHLPAGGRLRTFGVRDGLPSQEFHNRPGLMTAGGVGVASTWAGLLLFDPTQVRTTTGDAPLRLQALEVRRGEQSLALDPTRPPRLEHSDRDLRVVARLLSLRDPAGHRYRFRLDGHDSGWVNVGAGGERTFSRLPSGRYVLEVQATDAGGEWSPSRVLEISVAPPWWLSPVAWVAYALLGLLVLSWIAVAYRERLRRRHAFELAEQKRRMAEQASRAKTDFLATLGHEVRTPMTGVLGMSELLLAGPLQPRQRGQVEAIHRAGEHLLRLVNDALDLARIEAGKLVLEQAPFDLQALVLQACELLRPLAARKQLEFNCDFAGDLPRAVYGDEHRVRQILLNLGSNAIKFTEHGGIGIHARNLGESIELAVRDSGPGLNAEQRQRLFQRFEQAEGARTAARHGGSGLGLAISQELAAAMGGRIEVESTPGEGSCFRVRLPLLHADPASTEPVLEVAPPVAGGRLSILLVEDDPTIAEVIVGLLSQAGHEVVHEPHGLAALATLAARRFDIGLLDLDLPGLHGIELARLIRSQGHRLALVAITARADTEAEPAALAAGMDGFLRKPLTTGMLRGMVERHRPPMTTG